MMTTELPTQNVAEQYTHDGARVTQSIPSPPDKIYSIVIRQVDHGYMVEVGCKTFAIESAERLISLLTLYVHKPAVAYDMFLTGKLF